MTRPWVLLTNDDGVDSPALVPFARALAEADLGLGGHEVRVVVPDRERSWIGKAITRHGSLTHASAERDGLVLHTTSGTPADTVHIGAHGLFETRPALLVSGVNIGMNHGAAFLLSSGTVGAALEGWSTGIPSIAVSTGPSSEPWGAWRRRVVGGDGEREWLATVRVAAALVADTIRADLLAHADVVSINYPFDAAPDVTRRVTDVARVGYGPLLHRGEDGAWRHRFGELHEREDLAGTDVGAWADGHASLTPIRVPRAGDVPDAVRRALEGG